MRVLIASPYRTVVPHFENELEIAQRHLDQGDQVTFLSCLGELPGCDFNPTGDAATCGGCRLRRAHGLQMLDGRVRQISIESYATETERKTPPSFISIEQLKATKVANFDAGYAALSSLISNVRDPEPDLEKHSDLLDTFFGAATQMNHAMIKVLATERPDVVYVFNGRFAAMRGVLRACQLAGVDCLVHERGCDTSKYQLFRNRMPHDTDYVHRRMRRHWNRHVNDPNREAKARDWFFSRVRRVEKNWHSFVKNQQAGCLPDDWNIDEHNLVLFTSSEDEFAAIGDKWSNRLYPDQASAIGRLAEELLIARPDAKLTVRVHPNLIGVHNGSTRRLAAIDLPNVRMIPADEKSTATN